MSVTISWQVQDTFFGANVIMSVFVLDEEAYIGFL
jgi:hypothetical protein